MKRTRTRIVSLLLSALLLPALYGQLPCVGTIGTTSAVPNASWAPASGLPATTTISMNMTTTAGSPWVTLPATCTALIANLAPVSGPNVSGGTFISGGTCGAGTVQLSQNATVTGSALHVFTMPAYTSNFPPATAGIPTTLNCSVCPGLFTTPICANQYATYYMCAGNVYTISLCGSAALWNSTLSITLNTAGFTSAGGQGFLLSDDNGCGTANGHATITFVPTNTGVFRIRVFNHNPTLTGTTTMGSTTMTVSSTVGLSVGGVVTGPGIAANTTIASITNGTTLVLSANATSSNTSQPYSFPCIADGTLCGTMQITCSAAPPPPTNDGPCGAQPLPVGAACSPATTTTSWASNTSVPGGPTCLTYSGFDVWYSAVVPASGALAILTNHLGATNLAMAVYTATACNAALAGWTQQYCNLDLVPTTALQPFIAFNNPALAGQTVYIRIWPQGGAAAGGSFEICAYEPVPPPNDNPCAATNVPVTLGCATVSGTNQDATPTAGVPAPTCGITGTYNDVWFTVQVPAAPPGAGVIINTSGTNLDDAAMAVYTAPLCSGAYTQVGCNDPAAAGAMPSLQINQNGTTIVAGTTLYVRVWNKTAMFGSFSICATPTIPPSNNDPCGAAPLTLEYGCLYSSFTNTNASTTAITLAGEHLNAPVPSCGAPATNDVWFTITAPNPLVAGQSLVIDTDDGSLTNGAMAVYRLASGNCVGGSLSLTQLACSQGGSANSAAMPIVTILQSTLVPGETLYVRVWREAGSDGTFSICARRTDNPPGNCSYVLRLNDTANDGWNGSYVTVCVGAACTNYTINGTSGFITFSALFGQAITVAYTPVGGFQNQISYQLTTPMGGAIFNSGTNPASGFQVAFTVDANCNVPPAEHEDCIGAQQLCSNAAISANPTWTGNVVDLTPANQGCLILGERHGVWYTFQVSTAGQLGFTINAFPYGGADYDYGLWGPYASITCPPSGLPLRCSWGDGPVLTGLNWVATDFTEGANGDSWTQYITTSVGQWYLLFVDNFYQQFWGRPFDLTFQGAPGCGVGANPPCASISCILPVEFLDLGAEAIGPNVHLTWSTASERGSSHFEVERSSDGSSFSMVGSVEAAGNSSNKTDYSFIDRTPTVGTNYYRLKEVDLDGRTTWSNVVAVLFRSTHVAVEVFPNPATDILNVSIGPGAEQTFGWRIIDASGRPVGHGSFVTGPKANRALSVGDLESGSYLLEIHGENGVVMGVARFVRQ